MSLPRIKVMIIITRMVRGGAQLVVLELLKGLDPKRFDLSLVAGEQTGREGSLWHEVEKLEIPTTRVPELVRQVSPYKDFQAYRALRREILRQQPDVVHCHTSKAGLLGCSAARRAGIRRVVLSPHGHILRDGAEIPGVPSRGLRRRLLAAAARVNTRYADVVIAPNEEEREDGVRLRIWTREQSITVPNGVDTDRFVPRDRALARASLGWPEGETIVGTVARLTREKGVDVALSSITEQPGVRLVVVGDGPERNALRQQAQSLGIESRVKFLGVMERVENLLPAFDALLVPSRSEAHGLVAAEALACRVPVVCSGVGGLKSLVLHEQTGLQVVPNDPGALGEALRRLLENRPLGARLAAGGRAHVVENFSLSGMVSRTAQLYLDLVHIQSPRPVFKAPAYQSH
ncbi:MAG: glycosyltransferase [Planctomycetota bacterium]